MSVLFKFNLSLSERDLIHLHLHQIGSGKNISRLVKCAGGDILPVIDIKQIGVELKFGSNGNIKEHQIYEKRPQYVEYAHNNEYGSISILRILAPAISRRDNAYW